MINSGLSFNVSQKEIKRVSSPAFSRTKHKKLTTKDILEGWDSFHKSNKKIIDTLFGKISLKQIATIHLSFNAFFNKNYSIKFNVTQFKSKERNGCVGRR